MTQEQIDELKGKWIGLLTSTLSEGKTERILSETIKDMPNVLKNLDTLNRAVSEIRTHVNGSFDTGLNEIRMILRSHGL